MSEKIEFLAKFLRSPRTVGSVTPSSRFLRARMVEPIPWDRVRSTAELGAGTGVFTRAIAERSHPASQVVLFERDPDMSMRLRSLFPDFHHRPNALELRSAVRELGLPGLDCVISSLPLASLPEAVRGRLLDEVVGALNPGGLFVQFQYSLLSRRQLVQRFARVQTSFVPLNLPPAFVYTCQT